MGWSLSFLASAVVKIVLNQKPVRIGMIALPGFDGLDQGLLRELRTPDPQAPSEVQPVLAAV
jgi:hypothetical protein